MKKILILAAALLSIAGCKEKETLPDGDSQNDRITVSPENRTVGNEGGTVSVKVTSTSGWTVAAKDDARYDWVSVDKNSGQSGETVTFSVDPNDGETDRTAGFVFSCGKAEAVFTLVSSAGEVVIPTIELTSPESLEVESSEGELTVTLSVTNVDPTGLEASIEQTGSWLSFVSASAGSDQNTAVMDFRYTANDLEETRTATITVSYENADPVSVTVSQKGKTDSGEDPAGVYAPYMEDHCAEIDVWNNPDALSSFDKTISVECLINVSDRWDQQGNWIGEKINTILGLENEFLLRFGDNSDEPRKLEVIYYSDGAEVKLFSSVDIPVGVWTHLAVVMDGGENTLTIYQDGTSVASAELNDVVDVIDYTNEFTGWAQPEKFRLGRSSTSNRDFVGMMSEVRIWNRALSSDEINASGHFYSVASDSNGLVAYWKLDEGEGNLFKDSSPYGNNLVGKVFNRSSAQSYIDYNAWSDGMEWREAGFPEK